MRKSILTDNLKNCFVCGDNSVIHIHHIYGGANRKNSEKQGFLVPLCWHHHNGSNEGVHFDRQLDLVIKRSCQKIFEQTHTRAEFIKIIGRNYCE